MKGNLAQVERRRLILQENLAKARTELRAVEAGVAETVELSRARGDVILTPPAGRGERTKPAKRLDGLDFLAHQKVLTPSKYQAGRTWGALFGLLESGDLKSCLGVAEVRAQVSDLDPAQRKTFARLKLQIAKQALNHHQGMIDALDRVCGEGKRPSELSGDRRSNERSVSFLDCALTVLAKHWGV